MIHLTDIICLGLAVPEQIKDGRKTVCMAAYHADLGLIRIYPCRADMGLHRWQRFSAYVERNPQDTRYESFKFYNSRDGWDSLSVSSQGIVSRDERLILLDKLKTTCISDINIARLSLGIIKPVDILSVWYDRNPLYTKPKQYPIALVKSDEWVTTKSDYSLQPRIHYRCHPNCKGHNQTILEWGAFEWIRKNPGNEYQIIENWKLTDPQYEHFLLVGNQAQHRNSFLVINVIPFKTKIASTSSIKQMALLSPELAVIRGDLA